MSENLTQLLTLIRQLSDHSETLTQSITDLGQTLHNTREASSQLPELTGKLTTTTNSLNRMAEEISRTAIAVRETVTKGGSEMSQLSQQTIPGLQMLIDELRGAAENFRHFSEELERNPQILLYGQPGTRPGPGE